MKHSRKLLTLIFAAVLFIGFAAADASAQRRGGGRFIQRPIVVRQYYVRRYNPYWHWNSWDSAYFYDPYLSARRQRYYLESELRGNREELRKHLEKYNADGVITVKERKELDDDYRDVARAQRDLNEFRRRYR
ncbi:MAG TPA: hypothetical protein VF604_17295 [Pyrinomonadaceae bacterium]|jgi:hypothetical protein